ncbi:MAG TPA: M23 family metallopeptidase [Candidatus Acidoferrum sp.]|nr:M23 family metallopeptidase [Candidatus Acidoferrum sp.]
MRRTRVLVGVAALAAVVLVAGTIVALRWPLSPPAGPRFDLPVACPTDMGCVVRNFVDDDPAPDAKDWRCGRLTYDGHKGTDIRVPDGVAMAKGVQVLAAAPGTVLRLRDGMDDVSIRDTGADAVKDREAGNSLIIDHGGGWETQYAHLRKGSIIVKPGQTVTAGQPIGLMGLSGNTEFTHTHFEVRHNGKPVDPYTGAEMGAGCGSAGAPLWTEQALAALPYREDAPFDAGFADAPPNQWAARAGAYAGIAPTVDSPALVFWIDVLGHRAGDRQLMRLLSPDGAPLASTDDVVTEAHIQWFQFVGAKRPANGWPPGRYRGEYSLVRDVDGQAQTVVVITREIDVR